mmetsp:Transcript_38445/g.57585  ORF Transcript_38445/g.57585 Transcript_38445/m.57585 type:complete len:201 (-) Transcript_38445:635-1237(-)
MSGLDNNLLLNLRGLAVVAALMAVDLVVLLGSSVVLDDSPGALVLDQQGALGDTDIAHLAPELTPGVADNPVHAISLVLTPADNGDDVINTGTLALGDAALIVQKRRSIDSARDGASVVDFLHHGIGTADGAVVRDGDVGVLGEAGARTSLLGEAAASSGHVQGRAGGVDMGAEAFLRVRGAGKVRLRSLVGDAAALLGD